MRRRNLLALAGVTTLAWTPSVGAQQPATRLIGYLAGTSFAASASAVAAFREGLGQLGYVEGRNVTVAFRWAQGSYDRYPALAAELATEKVAVICAIGTLAALAARQASPQVPIVFVTANPVETGLVASLGRPGGNATGVDNNTLDLVPKRLEVLRDLLPDAKALAILGNATATGRQYWLDAAQAAARAMKFDLQIHEVADPVGIERAFASMAGQRPDALVVLPDLLFVVQREQIVSLAARHRIPAIYEQRVFTLAGGLVSYGPVAHDIMRTAGLYVGRILDGARPAELPVQLPTSFELLINIKTAKALGFTVPPALLARADEVIE